jgi:DUF4097 and DUF4098 domain-containing protein YvlB
MIIINGKSYGSSGQSVSVINGKVVVDGKPQELDNSPVFNITVQGNVGEVSGDFSTITVEGDVRNVSAISGDIRIGNNVNGNVSAVSGDIKVKGSIAGNATTVSGDIR